MGKPLHLAYRPANFDEVVGNAATIAAIKTMLERDLADIPHSWLFSGPPGCGKTTLARIIKDELGCSDMDFKEYNSGAMRGIDTIREIEQACRLAPMNGKVKVYLLDECHNFTRQAMEASLKMLEDAPHGVFFFLATTNPEKLTKAMRSRMTDVLVKPLNSREVIGLLKEIAEVEEKEIASEVYKAIALGSDGSAREAVKMLDTIFDIKKTEDALEVIQNTHIGEASAIELCRLLNKGGSWKNLAKTISQLTGEPEQTRRAVLTYFNKVLLGQTDDNPKAAEILECFERDYFTSGEAGLTLSCFQAFKL